MCRFVGNFNMHYIIFIIFFYPQRNQKTKHINTCISPILCTYIKLLSTGVHKLLYNMHVRSMIYWEFYHSIVLFWPMRNQNIKNIVHSICKNRELLWSGWYDSWIYDYLCNKCISPLRLRVWIPLRQGVLNTTLCDQVCLTCGRLVVFSRYSGFLHH